MNKKDKELFEEFLAFKQFKEQVDGEPTKKPKKIKRSKYTKRADGRYYTTISVGKDIKTGNPIKVTVYGKTEAELDNNKAMIKADYLSGRNIITKKILFQEYALKWLNMKKKHVSYKTWEMYDSAIRLYVDDIKLSSMKEISRFDIQQLIDKQLDKPRTCKKIAVTLNQIFEAAILDDIIFKNPVKGVLLPEYKSKKKRPLTELENTLSEVANFTDREKAYILLIKWCGLRKEEALALEINKFDFKKNTVLIDQAVSFINNKPIIKETKSDAGVRILPLVPSVLSFVKYYISNLSGNYLFTSIRSQELITEQSFKRMWESIIKKMNEKAVELKYKEKVKGLTSHIFRHNFATVLFQAGVPIKEAQYLLGHSSINVTMDIYTHIDPDKLKATDILNKFSSSQKVVKKIDSIEKSL